MLARLGTPGSYELHFCPSLEACSRIELQSIAGYTRAEASHEKTFHCGLRLIRDSKYDPSYCKVRRSVLPFSIFRCSLSPPLYSFLSSFISSFLFPRKARMRMEVKMKLEVETEMDLKSTRRTQLEICCCWSSYVLHADSVTSCRRGAMASRCQGRDGFYLHLELLALR